MPSNPRIIDTHCHHLPLSIIRRASFYPQTWATTELKLLAMEEAHVERALLSYPTTDALKKGQMQEAELAQTFNDELARVIKQFPTKFLGAALVPVGEKTAMLEEFQRATRELGLSALSMASSYDKIYLDDERFYPLYSLAEKEGIPLFVHATTIDPIGSERFFDPLLTPVMGYLFDVTICLGRMINNGVFRRFPQLKVIFAHFGGVIPFLRERFDSTYKMLLGRGLTKDIGALPSTYLGQVYFDTSGSQSYSQMLSAIEAVGVEHLLWGSDFPSQPTMKSSLEAIGAMPLGEEQKIKIGGENAAELFKL
jgi:predicted TIM-barrel fold metal-dependent hydrolase